MRTCLSYMIQRYSQMKIPLPFNVKFLSSWCCNSVAGVARALDLWGKTVSWSRPMAAVAVMWHQASMNWPKINRTIARVKMRKSNLCSSRITDALSQALRNIWISCILRVTISDNAPVPVSLKRASGSRINPWVWTLCTIWWESCQCRRDWARCTQTIACMPPVSCLIRVTRDGRSVLWLGTVRYRVSIRTWNTHPLTSELRWARLSIPMVRLSALSWRFLRQQLHDHVQRRVRSASSRSRHSHGRARPVRSKRGSPLQLGLLLCRDLPHRRIRWAATSAWRPKQCPNRWVQAFWLQHANFKIVTWCCHRVYSCITTRLARYLVCIQMYSIPGWTKRKRTVQHHDGGDAIVPYIEIQVTKSRDNTPPCISTRKYRGRGWRFCIL